MIPPITKLPEEARDPNLQFDARDVSNFAPPHEGPPWRDEDELTPEEIERRSNP
jgi:hypothetical protein